MRINLRTVRNNVRKFSVEEPASSLVPQGEMVSNVISSIDAVTTEEIQHGEEGCFLILTGRREKFKCCWGERRHMTLIWILKQLPINQNQ